MNRRELQALTRDRLADAKALLRAHRYSAAYYLAGYAVECALKSCISKKTNRHDFPDKELANGSYTHNLAKLVNTAELTNALKVACATDEEFEKNWNLVLRWSAEDRYNPNISKDEAIQLYSAIIMGRTGIMAWLRNHW